jgi:DNA-binding CsgD family transcriptional regulator
MSKKQTIKKTIELMLNEQKSNKEILDSLVALNLKKNTVKWYLSKLKIK